MEPNIKGKKAVLLAGLFSAMIVAGCKKDEKAATTVSVEQQKIEYQARQLELEKQRLAIEREKIEFEKSKDSIVKAEQQKTAVATNAAPATTAKTAVRQPQKRKSSQSSTRKYAAYDNSGSSNSGYSSGSVAQSPQVTQKKGISKAAKGTIIGTAGGAAAGAIISRKNRGAGAVIGGIVGGATGYTIGRSEDRKDGRIQ